MTPSAWVLVGVAMLLAPVGAARRHAEPQSEVVSGPPRWSVPLAALGVGLAAVALFGAVPGTLAAAVLCPVTWVGLRTLSARAARRAVAGVDAAVPLVLDLVAAALRAGRPPSAALVAAAPAAPGAVGSAFERVAGLLRLGAEPVHAWRVLDADGPLGPVVVVAVRSASSGARLAVAFERLAAELRAEGTTAAAVRAQRAGVLAMAPLAACFLPSFVVLGVIPVVVGMARSVFGGVP